jgi:hypothetical protein
MSDNQSDNSDAWATPKPDMSDRELLEMAAMAAGIEYFAISVNDGRGLLLPPQDDKPLTTNMWWNPLADDGDALRLACDLGLRVYPIARTYTGAACSAVGSVTCERLSEVVDLALDTRTATRRAIVRAAAEIGKVKP